MKLPALVLRGLGSKPRRVVALLDSSGAMPKPSSFAKHWNRRRSGHGQVVAVVGEPGVGKSRLFYEFMHSHRTEGCVIVESGSVSYGKATPYLPVIDLLKAYFKIHDRDNQRDDSRKSHRQAADLG